MLLSITLVFIIFKSISPSGLHTLNRLEYLSFAHNVLTHQVLKRDCAIASLQSLKKLDLSRNLLSLFPECLFELTK